MTVSSRFLTVAALLLAGCPQPPQGGGGEGTPPPQAPPGNEGGGNNTPARSASSGAPPASAGGSCEWAGTQEEFEKHTDLARVPFSGEITYDGTPKGGFLVDLLGEGDEPVMGLRCTEPGPFNIEIPADLGEIQVVLYADIDGNGPTTNDPAVLLADKITVGSQPIADVKLEPKEGADLGSLKLRSPDDIPEEEMRGLEAGGQLPEGGAPPPEGAPLTEGPPPGEQPTPRGLDGQPDPPTPEPEPEPEK